MAKTRAPILGTTRVLESVGYGGMAEIFRGYQELLQRPVAIKVMLPEIAAQDEMVMRFRREAFALSALQHENIVAIYDLIEKNNRFFMIMEYVEGVNMAEVIRDGLPPRDISLICGVGVARALEHAHFRRVIHRDIKPSNVMLSKHGQVKLTDFGIAKDLSEEDLTQAGHVVGTPNYFSPEQLTGHKADFRTDIYSLGVFLFQCLSGTRPFHGESTSELFKAIASGHRRRLRDINPGCPLELERIVDKCLEVDPRNRWRRASDVRQMLEQQMDRELRGTPSARLVAFLYDRGYIASKQLYTLDFDDISFSDQSIEISLNDLSEEEKNSLDPTKKEQKPPKPRTRFRRYRVAAVLILIVGILSMMWLQDPELVEQLAFTAWEFLRTLTP